MIRYAYIHNNVLCIYSVLPEIRFPLNVKKVVDVIPNCKFLSYQDFAKLNKCSVEDVIKICESESGCTMLDANTQRYLILCNQSTANNNNFGRQRWTLSHEIGHIMCCHHTMASCSKLSENNTIHAENYMIESEADYFAAMLLAPFPLYNELGVKSPLDVQRVFGLSTEASIYRYREYLKWKQDHRKTAWENDILNLYRSKA